MKERGQRPLMFVHVPHVFVAGPIDVSGLRPLPWDQTPESDDSESGSSPYRRHRRRIPPAGQARDPIDRQRSHRRFRNQSEQETSTNARRLLLLSRSIGLGDRTGRTPAFPDERKRPRAVVSRLRVIEQALDPPGGA
jgi:hypothetical protein